MASPQLVWQLVKGHNAFLKKNVNNTWFSAEAGNLHGTHSYKHSGLANNKTVQISSGADENTPRAVTVTLKSKKGGNATITSKKGVRRMQKSVAKQVEGYRPDLKQAATAAVCNVAAANIRAQRSA